MLNILPHFNLIKNITKREIGSRYHGSFLGRFWLVIQPLLNLSIYTFVFGSILTSRWPGGNPDHLGSFALILMAGLIPFNFWAECVQKSPGLIVQNPNYVTKVVFPLHILAITSTFSALFHAMIAFLVLLAFVFFMNGALHSATLAAPFLFIPLFLLCLSFSWIISALGVYLRDMQQIISLLVTGVMFLSPVFYPASSLPVWAKGIIEMNPLVFFIENMRGAIIFNTLPDLNNFLMVTVVWTLIALVAYKVFNYLSKGFADVL
jgi:lipopolysaccharide transport system permease protein